MSGAIECEKTLLGGLLLENKYFPHVIKSLCPKDFFSEAHAEIYEAMTMLYNKHKYVDVPMVCDYLNGSEKDNAYIYQLANECPSIANLKSHIDIIREKSVQRTLRECIENNPLHFVKFEGKILPLPSEENQQECAHCRLGDFFIELGHEINATQLTLGYLVETLYEASKAILDTAEQLEDDEEVSE